MMTIIKIGSSVLESNGTTNTTLIERIGKKIEQKMKEGNERFIIVSSGALLFGMMKLGLKSVPRDMRKRQAICAIGQPELMRVWSDVFARYNLKTSQILVTHEDIELPKRAKNLEETISEIIRYGAVPIINENDTIIADEIRFPDNDFLAAYISVLVCARKLVIVTDTDGVIDRSGNVIREIKPEEMDEIWEKIGQRKTKKKVFSGGIISKLTASKIAAEFGTECFIVNGRRAENVEDVLDGKELGTKIAPSKRYTKKELWMLKVMRGRGKIYIDRGAFEAIKEGKSLLSAGIIDVEGEFSAGDMVEVVFEDRVVGKGISNYFSSEIKLIKGKKTHEIKEVLGYKRFDEVIHRNNFVELEVENRASEN